VWNTEMVWFYEKKLHLGGHVDYNVIIIYSFSQIYYFFGHMVGAYSVAFVVSLAFESPMMGLEKAILPSRKKS